MCETQNLKKKKKKPYKIFLRSPTYIQIKKAKTPTQTTSLKNPVISLLKSAHALLNAVFTINKEFLKSNQVPSSRRKNNKKQQQNPHPTALPQ